MTTELAHRLVRRFAWEESELVEGTEALLWPAASREDAYGEELPDPSEAVQAVVSWVRANIIRFETESPEPLAELLLVSTLAVGGPSQFVVHKQYQVGNTAVCDPPPDILIVERRDLFRVPVATKVKISSESGELSLHSMDCSLGGLRICPSKPLDVGMEVDVSVELAGHTEVMVRAIVRHCRPYGRGAQQVRGPSVSESNLSIVGLQFLRLPSDVERHLTQFVGYHQRRLMPRVQAVTPVEYRSHGRSQFLEAFAVEVSPGDVVFLAYEAHQPGDSIELKLRLGRHDYKFNACTLSCDLTTEDEGVARRHIIRASLEDAGDAVEAPFRKAVRELAIEKLSSTR
jgi:c-di-GMP-binding flagellar brake protein YcgR